MPTRVPTSAPRTLAEDLRGRSDDALERLFAARPDLAHPAPQDMTQVATRAASRTSVAWAADRLDVGTLRILGAVAAADGPVAASDVARPLGLGTEPVAAALGRLHTLGLLWGRPDALVAVREAGEVVRAIADPVPHAPAGAPPELSRREVDARRLAVTSAGTATETVQRVETLLDRWGTTPAPVLRSGGLGVRDLRAAASALGVPTEEVERLVALARGASLLARGPGAEGDEAWMPTRSFDAWRADDVGARWSVLATGWRDGPGRAVRTLVLRVLGSVRPDAAASEQEVLDAVAWHAPRIGEHREPMALQVLAEAERLGVVVRGALSEPGAALLDGDPAAAMTALLPPPVDHLLLQADLTAVAPGPLVPEVARQVEELADAESTGGAAVYRFSESSLRRALDLGWPAGRIHAFLAAHARTPVPQPLTYLVDDAARRHGQVRVGRATSYLRCDDPAELEAIVSAAASLGLGLQRLGPTVAVADVPADLVLERVRAAGHRAVSEGADGAVEHARPRAHRAPVPQVEVRSGVDAAAAVAAVRAGEHAASVRPDAVTGDAVDRDSRAGGPAALRAVTALREAAEDRQSVWLSYMDQAGAASERVVDPVRVDAGVLTAFDHRSGRVQTFTLHRISRVAPAAASPDRGAGRTS